QVVSLIFSPNQVGAIQAKLTIASNDLDEGIVQVELSGGGVEPPMIRVEPVALAATLAGGQENQSLTISNGGPSPLEYSLTAVAKTAEIGGQAPATRCTPTSILVNQYDGYYGGALSSVDISSGNVTPIATGLSSPQEGLALNAAGTRAYVT